MNTPMSSSVPSGFGIASLIVVAIYCVAVHVLIVDHTMPSLTLFVISAPWLVAAGSAFLTATRAWSRSGIVTVVVVGFDVAAGAFCVWQVGRWLGARIDLPIFAESFLFLSWLAVLFAASLRGDREALVTRLARSARRGDMPPAVVRYTRRVTAGWAAFFALAATTSALLFATQSREAWSAFVNLALGPSTVAVFAIEYAIRRRVLPDVAHVSPMAGVRAFMQRGNTGIDPRAQHDPSSIR